MRKLLFLLVITLNIFACKKEEVEETPTTMSSTVTPPTDDFIGEYDISYGITTAKLSITDSSGYYIATMSRDGTTVGPLVGEKRLHAEKGPYLRFIPCTDGCYGDGNNNLKWGSLYVNSVGKLYGDFEIYEVGQPSTNTLTITVYEL